MIRKPFPVPLARLARNTSGVAMLELALALPIVLLMILTGAELTNFIITKMRISQIALQVADNAARMGTGDQLSAKTITEADINDLFYGAGLQAGGLDLYTRGRVILSSLEPMASPNTTAKYRIRWQRCRGSKTGTGYRSSYGIAGQTSGADKGTNLDGMGPAGRQVIAPENGVTMFAEVHYDYRPIIRTSLSPESKITQIATMMVRDRRDTAGGNVGVYPATGVTASTC